MTVSKNSRGSYSFEIEPFKKEHKKIKLELGQERKFEYNKDISYELNFAKWYRWNCDERISYNQEPYSKQEARKIFDNIWGAYRI